MSEKFQDSKGMISICAAIRDGVGDRATLSYPDAAAEVRAVVGTRIFRSGVSPPSADPGPRASCVSRQRTSC